MKKTVLIFIIFFSILSCSSNKIIENYMLEEIKTNEDNEIILIQEKSSFKNAIYIFKGLNSLKGKKAFSYGGSKMCDSIIYNELMQDYANETAEKDWKKNDFKKIDFKIMTGKNDSVIKYFGNLNKSTRSDELFVYSLSKPYFFKNKKYVFFNINKGSNMASSPIYNQVVILKKDKGKWIVVEKVETTDLY